MKTYLSLGTDILMLLPQNTSLVFVFYSMEEETISVETGQVETLSPNFIIEYVYDNESQRYSCPG